MSRVLPTETGWWWLASGEPAYVTEMQEEPEQLCVIVEDSEEDVTEYEWLCPIPTPEQLATLRAQAAAGQALADRVRGWQEAEKRWRDRKHGDDLLAAGEASQSMFEAESGLRMADVAAFPRAEEGT